MIFLTHQNLIVCIKITCNKLCNMLGKFISDTKYVRKDITTIWVSNMIKIYPHPLVQKQTHFVEESLVEY